MTAASSPGAEPTRLTFSSTVPPHLAGRTLVEYLAARFTYHRAEQWTQLVGEGRVQVNAQPAAAARLVQAGELVSYSPQPFDEPPADLRFTVVYEDDWLLGVNKPGDLLVHRAGRSFTTNLIHLVRQGIGCSPQPAASVVNRIDRGTSGVVLLARSAPALRLLAAAFRDRAVEKNYVAVVRGRPPAGVELIDAPVGRDRESAHGSRHRVDPAGKSAQTRITRVEPLGAGHSLLWLSPLTGRTHQLRLHCRHIGCPIVGDPWYGVAGDTLLGRPALHCCSLAFEHPLLHTRVVVEAPVAADLASLVSALA